MLKICKYCSLEFNARINKTYCCSNEECVKKKNAEIYLNRLYIKPCIVCENDFESTKKVLICSNRCKEKYNEKNIEIIQKIFCKKCDSFIKNKIVFTNIYGFNTISLEKNNRVCNECKIISLEIFRESQKGENNSNWKENKKIRQAKYTVEERKVFMSENNPMKNEHIKNKVSETIKKKYENGEIIRPIGKLSPLWKGNRKRSFTIRDRILWWKKEYLYKANYKCECCDNKKNLEVHHLNTPFRDLLKIVLKDRILDDLSYEDFEIVCIEMSELHKNEIGLVVCKECHSKVDTYRKIKNENKKDPES